MMKRYFILMVLVVAMSIVVTGANLYVKPASGTSGNGLTSVTAKIDNPGPESTIADPKNDYRIQSAPPAAIIEDNTENIASAGSSTNPLLGSISDFCIQLPPPDLIIEDNTENIASADIAPNPLLASISDFRIQEPSSDVIIEDNTENIASAAIAPNPLLASISDFRIQLPPPDVIIEDNTENIASAEIAPNPLLASISDYRIQAPSSDVIIEDNTEYTADINILNTELGIALTDVSGVWGIIGNPGKLSAYSISNTELKVKGNVSAQAMATLYDIHGHVIITKKLSIGDTNTIQLPTVKNGIYMLLVKDNGKTNSFKLFVME